MTKFSIRDNILNTKKNYYSIKPLEQVIELIDKFKRINSKILLKPYDKRMKDFYSFDKSHYAGTL